MGNIDHLRLVSAVGELARPLRGHPEDFDEIVARARDATVVLIGEATHGTREFYQLRADLTRRLIEDAGYCAVAAEADWPDAYRINRWVRGLPGDHTAIEALADFARFPRWMWRNTDVLDFIEWLRHHNEARPPGERAGFYGLDLYSLHASVDAVLRYLDAIDPAAAARARERYGCFDRFGSDLEAYGHSVRLFADPGCEREVLGQLIELRERRAGEVKIEHDDARFVAEQNARVVHSAEAYYRTMFNAGVSSWNLRDEHMADTLDALLAHLGRARPARIVVWAHNSHVGDARATDMGRIGELNIGQLTRERHAHRTVHVGFSTYDGSVVAAPAWGATAERMTVRPALPASYEALFHEVGQPSFLLSLTDLGEASGGLCEPHLTRAIGVVYRPQTERTSHYFHASLPGQFDFVMHVDRTRALEPLERDTRWTSDEPGETFPTGL